MMHDRAGFYIVYGVLAVVPILYCVPAVYLTFNSPEITANEAVAWFVIGLVSLYINWSATAHQEGLLMNSVASSAARTVT